MKKLVVWVVMGLILAGPTTLIMADCGKCGKGEGQMCALGGDKKLDMLALVLDLSDKQKEQVKALGEKKMEQVKAAKEEFHAGLKKLLNKDQLKKFEAFHEMGGCGDCGEGKGGHHHK